ncbi:ASCH domain-containing protein, partial [Salmonella enterica subsp. enterica serovar Typhimurium]|nr:ASCH domain-containing protein [Salmonella enterica subsp. enterica serovar Typhimurium]
MSYQVVIMKKRILHLPVKKIY